MLRSGLAIFSHLCSKKQDVSRTHRPRQIILIISNIKMHQDGYYSYIYIFVSVLVQRMQLTRILNLNNLCVYGIFNA